MLAQGKILSSASVTTQGGSQAVIIPIQSAMAPKCRLLAYFIRQTPTGEEIVSDSVELNVEAMCKTKDVMQRFCTCPESRLEFRSDFTTDFALILLNYVQILVGQSLNTGVCYFAS